MDNKIFNELLKRYNYDEEAKDELCHYCLANIKRRLIVKYGFISESDELKDTSHEILKGFLKRKSDNHVYAPFKYINKATDNFMASRYKNKKEVLPLIKDIPYEQRFEALEKFTIYNVLLKFLDERSAKIIYLHYIEEISEKEIAQELKISYENVRVIASRGIKKLKENSTSVTKLIKEFS